MQRPNHVAGMCPYFDPPNRCYLKKGKTIGHMLENICKNETNCKNCGNYEAWESGNYNCGTCQHWGAYGGRNSTGTCFNKKYPHHVNRNRDRMKESSEPECEFWEMNSQMAKLQHEMEEKEEKERKEREHQEWLKTEEGQKWQAEENRKKEEERKEKERKEREHQEWLTTDDGKNWQRQLAEKAAELRKNIVPEKGVLGVIFNILFVLYIIFMVLFFIGFLGVSDVGITDLLLIYALFSPAAIPFIIWLIVRKKKEKKYYQAKAAYDEVMRKRNICS